MSVRDRLTSPSDFYNYMRGIEKQQQDLLASDLENISIFHKLGSIAQIATARLKNGGFIGKEVALSAQTVAQHVNIVLPGGANNRPHYAEVQLEDGLEELSILYGGVHAHTSTIRMNGLSIPHSHIAHTLTFGPQSREQLLYEDLSFGGGGYAILPVVHSENIKFVS